MMHAALASDLPCRFDGLYQLTDGRLRVAIEHASLVEPEQGMVASGETLALAALDHDDVFCFVGVQDRHAVNRAPLVGARIRIDDVIGADDQRYVRGLELRIDL